VKTSSSITSKRARFFYFFEWHIWPFLLFSLQEKHFGPFFGAPNNTAKQKWSNCSHYVSHNNLMNYSAGG